jgi:hypothetical protein
VSGTAKWLYRHSTQDVCPWNVRFARPLGEPAYAPRPTVAGKDTRTLAREILNMTQPEFSAAFKGSPMKRAKLRGLKRNAAVVLGNVGTMEDLPVLEQALADPEPLVREHAAWAIRLLSGDPDAPTRPISEAGGSEPPRAVQPETLIPRRGSGAGVP